MYREQKEIFVPAWQTVQIVMKRSVLLVILGLFIHGNQGKTRTQVEDGVEGTDVLIPLVPLYLVLMILPVLIPMESESLVVKVAEVEVVTMTATMVESTVMITMIWTLDLHLAVLHLVVLVEIGVLTLMELSFLVIVKLLMTGLLQRGKLLTYWREAPKA